MVLSGRFHFYEGRSWAEMVYPVHVIDALNIKVLIVTNATGGINPVQNPGDLMIIEDHINFMESIRCSAWPIMAPSSSST